MTQKGAFFDLLFGSKFIICSNSSLTWFKFLQVAGAKLDCLAFTAGQFSLKAIRPASQIVLQVLH